VSEDPYSSPPNLPPSQPPSGSFGDDQSNQPPSSPSRFHNPDDPADTSLSVPTAESMSTPAFHPDELANHDDPIVPMPNQSFTPNQSQPTTARLADTAPIQPTFGSDTKPVVSSDDMHGAILSTDSATLGSTVIPPAMAASENVAPPIVIPQQFASPKKSRAKLFIIIAAVAVLLIGGGAFAAYQFTVVEPQQALAGYLKKIGYSKSGKYKGTLAPANKAKDTTKKDTQVCDDSPNSGVCAPTSPSGDDFKVAVSGEYDLGDIQNPKTSLAATLTVGAVDYSGDFRLLNKAFFFKIGDIGALGASFPISKDWYKVPLEDEQVKEVSKCQIDGKKTQQVINENFLVDFPVKNTKRIGMSETIDGKSTTHYNGEIDFTKLQTAVDKANKQLPADCKITVKSDDFKDIEVKYNLWTSPNFDRITIQYIDKKSKDVFEVTFDTSDYNKPVKIEEPTNPKSIDELEAALNGEGENNSTVDDSTSKSNDTQRKADVGKIQALLEEYAGNNNGSYPNPGVDWISSTSGQSPKGKFGDSLAKTNIKDPLTSASYEYFITGNELVACSAQTKPSAISKTIISYQSKTKRSYTLRVCLDSGETFDRSKP